VVVAWPDGLANLQVFTDSANDGEFYAHCPTWVPSAAQDESDTAPDGTWRLA
jgi:hypothetical protein